ncbi:PIG-L deacetylase family protein [Mycobacterium sp. SM1]|uniref:PIG-L deacetylase family protein n=1 Tax=Mycobacterium sp. SM1 TaxID=2816243 RepID=UPI001F3A8878|nr:PIG-L deacetylase family protein [Mycobacterium sp. SM1]
MTARQLPGWRSVLAVVAHPDDESFGLGAILSAFAQRGARLAVLCLTHGEASTLHGVAGDLACIRAGELAAAAEVLGVSAVELLDYPDGRLAEVSPDELAVSVVDCARRCGAEGLLVFDRGGVTGHPDHRQATAAALLAAAEVGLPVLGWTLPAAVAEVLNCEYAAAFIGHRLAEIDVIVPVDRRRQYQAVCRHLSQALPSSVLWRRLELLGPFEHLRWLSEAPDKNPGRTPDLADSTRSVTRSA